MTDFELAVAAADRMGCRVLPNSRDPSRLCFVFCKTCGFGMDDDGRRPWLEQVAASYAGDPWPCDHTTPSPGYMARQTQAQRRQVEKSR